ncbi:MAG: hypothetical protein ACRDLE_05010 [Gaiellaceae bacterium]
MTPKRLAAAGASLLAIAIVLAIVLHTNSKPQTAPPPPAPTTTTTAPPPTTTAPPPPPTPIAMSFADGGGIIVHTGDVGPEWLGRQLRAAGFGWVAVDLGPDDPPDLGWIERFEQASGLAVGGWSVLGDDPKSDAAYAVSEIHQNGLSFYIADAEAPYQADPARSQQFVDAFRAAEPNLPAGLSSLCDAGGIGLAAWANAGFDFLPQAYVNDFGDYVTPATCVHAAAPWFPVSRVHPTVGSYHGQHGWFAPGRYVRLLAEAGTTGFSVYPAETAMTAQGWQTYGDAIKSQHIAARPTGS